MSTNLKFDVDRYEIDCGVGDIFHHPANEAVLLVVKVTL